MIKRQLIAIGAGALFPLITVAAVAIAAAVEFAVSGIRHQIHR
jgi:hypothetical protein